MKRNLIFFVMLCVAHITCFSQVKVNTAGNTGMGASPNTKAKLLLYNSSTVNDTIFGLRMNVKKANSCSYGPNMCPPLYGIYSENATSTSYSPLYGAYFKNSLSSSSGGSALPLYGIFVNNTNSAYVASNYGVYVNNVSTNDSGETCGFYANNVVNGTSTGAGSTYGAYLINSKGQNGSATYSHSVYGLYSKNTNSAKGLVYGAYLSATSSNASTSVYGIRTLVSGGNANDRYAGYFEGGKVYIDGKLDVYGYADFWGGGIFHSSDERLKSNVKPLTDEKEKLYLLQGKSYLKTLPPPPIVEEDSLLEKREIEIVEMPEYGYLAQELKEIFPDLVKQSQDSTGYYSVNYIGLIPIIIEALKDQRLEIEKKQIQIDEQREQIKQLVKLLNIKSIDGKMFEENGIESLPILLQNTPNPFNQATEIGYYIPETVSSANIYIYDVTGFQQRNIAVSERGKGATVLQASALQAGIYFYTLICDGKPVDTKQMILTR